MAHSISIFSLKNKVGTIICACFMCTLLLSVAACEKQEDSDFIQAEYAVLDPNLFGAWKFINNDYQEGLELIFVYEFFNTGKFIASSYLSDSDGNDFDFIKAEGEWITYKGYLFMDFNTGFPNENTFDAFKTAYKYNVKEDKLYLDNERRPWIKISENSSVNIKHFNNY